MSLEINTDIDDNLSENQDFLSNASVVIIGLGLMGGSLAMALSGRCKRLLGIDHDPSVVTQARERKLVDSISCELAELLPYADLVVFAIPVRASIEIIRQLPDLHKGQAIVMDLGSTKQVILTEMDMLPGRFDPLGGHPMCGKETGGLVNAEAGLYKNAPFALVPLPRTTQQARHMAVELVTQIGAKPIWIEATEHDYWVAATSHLPHVLATALALCTSSECAPMIGPGFRSTSRLADGSAEMKVDIFATNGEAILQALEHYRFQLDKLEDALRCGDMGKLKLLFDLGSENRHALLSRR